MHEQHVYVLKYTLTTHNSRHSHHAHVHTTSFRSIHTYMHGTRARAHNSRSQQMVTAVAIINTNFDRFGCVDKELGMTRVLLVADYVDGD